MEYILAILVIILMPVIMYMSYIIMAAPVIFFICTIGTLVDTFININRKLLQVISPKLPQAPTISKPIEPTQIIEE